MPMAVLVASFRHRCFRPTIVSVSKVVPQPQIYDKGVHTCGKQPSRDEVDFLEFRSGFACCGPIKMVHGLSITENAGTPSPHNFPRRVVDVC